MGPISQQNSTQRVAWKGLAIGILILPLTVMCMSGRGWAEEEEESVRVVIVNNTSEDLGLWCTDRDGKEWCAGIGIKPGCCPDSFDVRFRIGYTLFLKDRDRKIFGQYKVTTLEPGQRFVVKPPSSKSAE